LAFSLLLRPDLPQRVAPLFSLASALGVAEATETLCGLRPTLKWPNDLLLEGKKFCGILCESAGEPDRIAHVIAGIGINVLTREEDFPPEVRTTATSIVIASGKEVSRTALFAATLRSLAKSYGLLEGSGEEKLIEAYRKRCDTVGQTVRVVVDEGSREGVAEGIGPEGALLVRIDGELRPFHAADVIHLRRAEI
jgi:BirA family biotin operon repressor/biotin-[acetyl-CoA-carboxylase] ligase